MAIEENPVFKFISFRAPVDGLAVDPSEDNEDSEVVVHIRTAGADTLDLRATVLALLENRPRPSVSDLHEFVLWRVANLLDAKDMHVFRAVDGALLERGGAETDLADFAGSTEYRNEYRQLFESWLSSILTQDTDAPVEEYERLIRVAHLCGRLRNDRDSLREPGIVENILGARIVLPRQLRRSSYRLARLNERHARRLRESEVSPSTIEREIAAKQKEYSRLTQRIATREAIQLKANDIYWQWKHDRQADGGPPSAEAVPDRTVGGLIGAVSTALFGDSAPPVARRTVAPPALLDDEFYRRLEARLTAAEREELDAALGEAGGTRPVRFSILDTEVLDTGRVIVDANNACSAIRVFEQDRTRTLPRASSGEPMEDRPSVRAIGWGDLIVARERLVGYDAREIAHIENVLSGEKRVREHERTRRREGVVETETESRTESERDLQTTDRYELQTETTKTVDEEFAVDAGVNTSGRYGLTKVETSLDVGFRRSSSEARSSSVELAKEIVSRAVERVFESVREMRRVTISEQIRELNKHIIDNTGGDAPPPSQSGIHLWVEKVEEVELRHYGTRLMVEFHIPEPAVSFLERDPVKVDARRPAPFELGPADVTEGNYLCLTKLFGAQEVEPPPAQFIDVGFAWASTPDEDIDEDKAEDTLASMIAIPAGYQPVSGTAHVTSIAVGDGDKVYLYLSVGGREVIDDTGQFGGDEDWTFDPADPWPDGVPVSLAAHGHYDKTMVVQVAIRCKRKPEAMTRWKLSTWEKVREAHAVLVREYKEAVEEAEFVAEAFELPVSRPAEVNRAIERDELKKWSIKTMRIDPFNFDAIAQVGEHQEVDPLDSDLQAPIVRFFEEAFEWRQMSYFLYPYFWGRRDAWPMRLQISNPDPKHEAFLKAGAARVVMPVTPGYEDRVLHYLDSDPDQSELERIRPLDSDDIPADSDASDLWLELLLNRNERLALGSGTLTVTQGSKSVRVNDDSTWSPTERDLGRELYIFGNRYFVDAINGEKHFDLNVDYVDADNPAAKYATGSLPFGPPWLERIPTSLVVLSDQKAKLPGS